MSASVIAPATWDDEWFGQLSDREMLIWIGVFSRLRDDQGRFVENAALARARLFPYRDVPVADVQAAFDHFVADNRLHRYEAAGQHLLQIVTWWQHQRPRWASPSSYEAPIGWTDRVRHRDNGQYVTTEWDADGGFKTDSCEGSIRDLHTNASREHVVQDPHTNPSNDPFVLAHEPEPEPEPVKRTPLPPEPVDNSQPVDNSADQERVGSFEPEEQEPPASHPAKIGKTCDGEPCSVHDFPAGAAGPLRRAMLKSLHPEQWKEFGTGGELDAVLAAYAAHVCTACQDGFAKFERPQRDTICEKALVASVEGLDGSKNVKAVMRSRLDRWGIANLIGDRTFEELRRSKRNRARKGDPRPIGEVLPPAFAQPRGPAKPFDDSATGAA